MSNKKPNILYIINDDQGQGDFSCFGNNILSTPNLDQLCKESVRLSNYHVNPLCAPTRAALLSGQYNLRTGVTGTNTSRTNIRTGNKLISEYLSEAGYATGMFGKWHMGHNYPSRPQDRGFDRVVTWEYASTRFDPLMEFDSEWRQCEGFHDDIVADETIRFIEDNQNRPFFAYMATHVPHNHFKDAQVEDRYVEPFNDYPELNQHTKEVYGMVAKLDKIVGRVLDRLNELGLADDTVVIYHPDHGGCIQHHFNGTQARYNCGLRGSKNSVYDGGIRVPCFIRWPDRFPAGKVVDSLTAHLDMLPTVLDICGIKPDPGIIHDGASIKSSLKGEQLVEGRNEYFLKHHQSSGAEKSELDGESKWLNSCAISGDYKLVDGKELYNLAEDPAESIDLSDTEPDNLQSLRDKYAAWISQFTRDELESETTVIGSEQQLESRLCLYDCPQPHGWPVKFTHPGPYRVIVRDIRNEQFGEDAQLVLKVGDKTWRAPVNRDSDELSFEAVEIPLGEYRVVVTHEGHKEDATWDYAQNDTGYRSVTFDRR